MPKCINCGEPLYIRRGHDIRVFHAQFSEFRKTKKGQNCKNPKTDEVEKI